MKKLNDLLSEVTKVRTEIKSVQAEEKLLKTQQRELESQISIRMQEKGSIKFLMMFVQSHKMRLL